MCNVCVNAHLAHSNSQARVYGWVGMDQMMKKTRVEREVSARGRWLTACGARAVRVDLRMQQAMRGVCCIIVATPPASSPKYQPHENRQRKCARI